MNTETSNVGQCPTWWPHCRIRLDGLRWRFLASFLRPVFPASCVQHISDLHSKFALRPHHVWKYGRHPICSSWD